jgi:endoglucanase
MKLWIKIIIAVIIPVMGFNFSSCAGGSGAGSSRQPGGVSSGNDSGSQGNYHVSSNTPSSPQSFNDITAAELVSQMKLGWNLGNTLDASDLSWLGANASVSQLERAWGNPVTTQANIDAIKNGGFDIIRIPVSWAKAANSNYIIRSDWMDRVTEVVNYAVNNDMYIVLNTHHDEGIFKFTNAAKTESLKAFRIIWEQIALNFKNYNEKLIFEGLNEPRTKGSSAEWNGGTSEERSILNEYYEIFVDIVRKSGGNNDKRVLMVNTYAASANSTAVNGLNVPPDTAANKIIVSIHAYAPYNFALNQGSGSTDVWSISNSRDTSDIINALTPAYNKFVQNGIPVIMGEFGAVNRNNNDNARAAWAEYYTSQASQRGIPCIIWDNGGFTGNGELFGFLNRSSNTFPFPGVLDALKRGAGVQ